MERLEEDATEEFVGEAAAHMKTELKYKMSLVTLKIQSGTHSQTIQGRGPLRTWCAQSSWQLKRGAPPSLSVLKSIMIIGKSLISALGFKTQA